MTRRFQWFVALGLIIAGAQAVAQRRESRPSAPETGPYGWLTSLDEARAEAQKTGMPIMVVIRCQP
jgi:hypothetical protein